MTKVYLIMGSHGEWEDYHEYIHCARFNEDEAKKILGDLNHKIKDDTERFNVLAEHVEECEKDKCKLCDEFYDLQSFIYDLHDYRIREIEVE